MLHQTARAAAGLDACPAPAPATAAAFSAAKSAAAAAVACAGDADAAHLRGLDQVAGSSAYEGAGAPPAVASSVPAWDEFATPPAAPVTAAPGV